MTDYIYILYAVLAGSCVCLAWLTAVQPHIVFGPRLRVVGYAALGFSFAALAAGRVGLFGLSHGSTPWITRAGFIIFGLSVLYRIGQHFWLAWRRR